MGVFVEGNDFDPKGGVSWSDPDRPFYTASRLEWSGGSGEDFHWVCDYTLVTDSCGIAAQWALAHIGLLDDGEHPWPIARVNAHRSDPAELDVPADGPVDENEETPVLFVTPSEFLSASDERGRMLAEQTAQYSEIIKIESRSPKEDEH